MPSFPSIILLLEWLWWRWWWWLISLSNKHCTWIFNWIHLSSFCWWINYYYRHIIRRIHSELSCDDDDVFMKEFFFHPCFHTCFFFILCLCSFNCVFFLCELDWLGGVIVWCIVSCVDTYFNNDTAIMDSRLGRDNLLFRFWILWIRTFRLRVNVGGGLFWCLKISKWSPTCMN